MNLYRRSTAQVAATIADPVERLRFLRARAAVRARRRQLARRWFLLLALVSITAATLVPKASPSRSPAVVVVPIPIPRIADTRSGPERLAGGEDRRFRNVEQRFADRQPFSGHDAPALISGISRGREFAAAPDRTGGHRLPYDGEFAGALRRERESGFSRRSANRCSNMCGDARRTISWLTVSAGCSAWCPRSRRRTMRATRRGPMRTAFYINLNDSFLGVSFEAASPGGLAPAQVSSARVLIEMLRHRFEIAASNCVTHAQVSVNSSNMLAGLHVDWAAGFPFEAVGLTDNYLIPSPLVWELGFDYDAHFRGKAGEPLRAAIDDAEAIVAAKAASAGVSRAAYKERLQRRYREMLNATGRGISGNRSRLRSSP